ncbi:hypothetical protein, partial [Helicobacter marmotae]|uniref:hypothetical protein n=2 Tax=Helicobacter marmotae TaxID=152490 RepID=UPI001315ADA0
SLSYCHSEGAQGATEESLKESLVAKRDSSLDSQAQNDKPTTFTKIPKSNDSQKAHRDSSPLAGVQNDKIISLAGSQVCHSEGGRSPTEESLLSTKDSLTKSLERRLLCHSKSSIKGEELFLKTPKSTTSDSNRDSSPSARVQNDKLCYPQKKFSQDDNVACMRGKLFCHSERSEESLKESLVTHRDSSPLAGVQNDNSGRVSSNSKRDSSAFANSRNNKLYVLMGNRLSHTQGKLTPHNNPTHSNTRRSVC